MNIQHKLFKQLIIFLCISASISIAWASDSRGILSDKNRCLTVNSQDIDKICYHIKFKWRFEPIAFKAKFRLEPSFSISKVYWKQHIDANSAAAKNKQKNLSLGQSIFSAKVSANKWFIFTTQKITQNTSSVQSKNLKWGKMVAKSCGDNNRESECSCFTNEANRNEKVSPFYISSATAKDLLRGGFELNSLKPCRLNFSGIIKPKSGKETSTLTSSKSVSSSETFTGKEVSSINEEVLYWNLIKRNPSLSKYQEFIKDFPNGQFVRAAKMKIAQYNNTYKKNFNKPIESDPIAICHSLLRKNQLTSGKSGNANQCFKAILDKEPDNFDAKSGLLAIEKRYVSWAKNALKSGNMIKVKSYIKKIELVNPDSLQIAALKKNIADKELQSTQTVNEKLSKLQMAINDNDIKTSEELLEQLKKSNIPPSKYDDLNIQFIKMKSTFYYNAIKDKLNKKQLKQARTMLDKFRSSALDYSKYIELNNLYQTLLEDADKAHLKLTTTVAGSLVELNGIEKGDAPLELSINKGEKYQLKVTKKGYVTQIINVTIYSDRELNIEMQENARYIIRNGERIPVTTPLTADTPRIAVPEVKAQIPSIKDPVSGIEMINIKPGCFTMGSPRGEQRRDFDEKQHKVCFKQGFKMGKYEVTQQQWQAVMGRNPAYFDECGTNCPIEDIDWYDVQSFIKKLNRQSDLTDLNYRLPTEAEWEYAARAGTTTPYNTGSCILPEQANYKTGKVNCIKTDGQILQPGEPSRLTNTQKLPQGKTHPVGSYPANAWGLYDMHGNVREWTCSEYFASYNGSERRCHVSDLSITGAVDNSFHISNRGGSWGYKYQWARSAERDKDLPTANNKNLGFRLMRQ